MIYYLHKFTESKIAELEGVSQAAVSANTRDRAEIEKSIRQHLKVEDTKTVKAIMTKAKIMM